jgi:hypothetical protein
MHGGRVFGLADIAAIGFSCLRVGFHTQSLSDGRPSKLDATTTAEAV